MITAPRQLDLFHAQQAGHVALTRAADKAERQQPGFLAEAAAEVLRLLARYESLPGETLVNEVKKAGIVPDDDRSFGAVFKRLSTAGKIDVCGFCLRARGNGTSGGRIWRLSNARH